MRYVSLSSQCIWSELGLGMIPIPRRISSDTAIPRLLYLRIRRAFLPYFFGYDAHFSPISSDTTRISSVFFPTRQLYDFSFFGYDVYFFRISSDMAVLRLLFLRIRLLFFLDTALLLLEYPIFFVLEFHDLYSSLFLLYFSSIISIRKTHNFVFIPRYVYDFGFLW